jgi:hypothetical protein
MTTPPPPCPKCQKVPTKKHCKGKDGCGWWWCQKCGLDIDAAGHSAPHH